MPMRVDGAKFSDVAEPVAFCGMAGLYMPAPASDAPAVLFVSPWGLEEMCVRKFWRVIAEKLVVRGIASLRFDLPGTGDSLDPPSFSGGLALWERATLQAGEYLQRRSGARGVVLVGQGVGAVLSMRVSSRLEGLAGMALLAPVVSGRFYLREIAAMARMVDDSLGLCEEHRQTCGVSIAGFRLPDAVAADLKRLDLMAADALPAVPCLVAERVARPADGEFATFLAAGGMPVEKLVFDGYEALTANPAVSKVPEGIAHDVAAWVAAIPSAGAVPAAVPSAVNTLEGADFKEVPVCFGSETPLYGALCQPLGQRRGATVLLLGTAYDRHAGWGRSGALMARALATRGIACLRFDAANVADSPPVPSAPEQVLYDRVQIRDVRAALDFLAERDMGPVVVAGRCSGAYLAFRAAVEEPRIAGAVVVNPFTFRWQEGRDVDTALVTVPRALADYGQRALQWATVKRFLRGEIDLRRALANVSSSLFRRFAAPLLLHVRQLTGEGRALREDFQEIADRNMKMTLVYSANDVGWDYFSTWFGARGERLRNYPNVQLAVIPNADHNLTPEHARGIYLDEVTAMALQVSELRRNA